MNGASQQSSGRAARQINARRLIALGIVALLAAAGLLAAAPWLLANNARYYLLHGAPDRALARIAQARQWGMSETEADTLRLKAFFQSGAYADCLAAAERLGEKPWGGPDAWLQAAFSALELREDSRARPWLKRYGEARGADPLLLRFAQGGLALQNNNWNQAIDSLKGASFSGERETFFSALWLGRAFLRAGRPAEAVDPLNRARAARPNSLEPWLDLARAYRALGDGESVRWLLDEIRFRGGDADSLLDEDAVSSEWIKAAGAGQPLSSPPGEGVVLALERFAGDATPEATLHLLEELKRSGDAPALVAFGRALEDRSRPQDASTAYEAAREAAPQSLVARFYAERARRGATGNAPTAALLQELARQMAPGVEWASTADFRFQDDPARPFGNLLVSNGCVAASLRPPSAPAKLLVCLAATKCDGVGAWAEIRWGGQTRRFYVDSLVPTVAIVDVPAAPDAAPAQLQVWFTNDKSHPQANPPEDRNLYVYGAGLVPAGEGLP
ncbi:MAG: hypothetical protein NTW86_29030 [Candidatus Sumerlaeota bacterium]|nr:hypothetical protein [Candidatus Sumerlaeota bacterium]